MGSTDIAVSVKVGVVALSGFVPSFTDRYEAETAAKRVCGVSGVAVDLEVRLPNIDERPDPDVARDAVAAVKSQLPVSAEMIKTTLGGVGCHWKGRSSGNINVLPPKRPYVVSRASRASTTLLTWSTHQTGRRQAKYPRGVLAQRSGGCRSCYGRSQWWRGYSERNRPVMDRARRSRARRLVGPGSEPDRGPHRRFSVVFLSPDGRAACYGRLPTRTPANGLGWCCTRSAAPPSTLPEREFLPQAFLGPRLWHINFVRGMRSEVRVSRSVVNH